tara:strand:- start:615 stop:818 length:204 start_codon:yes stop_codon:yes gene_type:complete
MGHLSINVFMGYLRVLKVSEFKFKAKKRGTFSDDSLVDNPIEIVNIHFTPKDFNATAEHIELLILKI